MKTRAKTKTAKKEWGSFDWENGRKTALQTLKTLRRVRKQMASDPSVCELSVNQLTYALGAFEDLISHLLLSPASQSKAKLPPELFGEEDTGPGGHKGETSSDNADGGQHGQPGAEGQDSRHATNELQMQRTNDTDLSANGSNEGEL